jgi:hypothetical protein
MGELGPGPPSRWTGIANAVNGDGYFGYHQSIAGTDESI